MGVVTAIPIIGAHAELAAEADKLGACIARFGGSIEDLLAKYQKKIVDEQFLLWRVAEAGMDIYAMSAVLSRASASLTNGTPSAEHEKIICQTFIEQGSERVNKYLAELTSPSHQAVFKNLSTLSKQTVSNAGVLSSHPLGF